jgi:hypothetical protein
MHKLGAGAIRSRMQDDEVVFTEAVQNLAGALLPKA